MNDTESRGGVIAGILGYCAVFLILAGGLTHNWILLAGGFVTFIGLLPLVMLFEQETALIQQKGTEKRE